MRKDDHPLLIQYSLPNLIKLQGSKMLNDNLEVTAYIQLIHLQLRPTLTQPLTEFFVCSVNKGIIVELPKEGLCRACQSQLQISEEWKGADHCNSLLHVRPGNLTILCLHFLCYFNLLKIRHSKQHAFLPLPNRLKIKEVIILHLVMRTIRHRMMHYQILDLLNCFTLRIPMFYLSPSLMMKMYNGHTQYRVLDLMIPLFIFIHNFL